MPVSSKSAIVVISIALVLALNFLAQKVSWVADHAWSIVIKNSCGNEASFDVVTDIAYPESNVTVNLRVTELVKGCAMAFEFSDDTQGDQEDVIEFEVDPSEFQDEGFGRLHWSTDVELPEHFAPSSLFPTAYQMTIMADNQSAVSIPAASVTLRPRNNYLITQSNSSNFASVFADPSLAWERQAIDFYSAINAQAVLEPFWLARLRGPATIALSAVLGAFLGSLITEKSVFSFTSHLRDSVKRLRPLGLWEWILVLYVTGATILFSILHLYWLLSI